MRVLPWAKTERFDWVDVPDEEHRTGPFCLERNGNYKLGPMSFDQRCSVVDCQIGGLVVNKTGGSGEILSIDGPGVKIRVRFIDGRWKYLRRA